MMLFSHVQEMKNQKVIVPVELCESVGMSERSDVLLTFDVESKGRIHNEIICSPIPMEKRIDPWILRAAFWDRKGIIAELTKLLGELNIDIQFARVGATESNKFLNVEFHLDLTQYDSRFDRDENKLATSLIGLETFLVSHFIGDILFLRKNEPFISIYRNSALFRNRNQRIWARTNLANSIVEIPSSIMTMIKESFQDLFPSVSGSSIPLASVIADTESQFIRIYVFFENTGYLHIRVSGENKVKGLATISEALSKADYNICQMHSRVVDNWRLGVNDFFIQAIPGQKESLTDDALKKELIHIFSTNDELKNYRYKIHTPSRLREHLQRRLHSYQRILSNAN